MITLCIARRTFALRGVSPVFGSNCQPCHGHTSFPSSTRPWPSGPPQCGHTLSVAHNSPFTLAMHTLFPSAMNSFALPHAGKSDLTVTLTKTSSDCISSPPSIRQTASFQKAGTISKPHERGLSGFWRRNLLVMVLRTLAPGFRDQTWTCSRQHITGPAGVTSRQRHA